MDLGDDRWRWELQPIGVKSIAHQVIYSVQYIYEPEAGCITWTPLQADTDNADIQGLFTITPIESGCEIKLTTDGLVNVPAPQILAGAIKPIVEHEFAQQIDAFISNLKKALG